MEQQAEKKKGNGVYQRVYLVFLPAVPGEDTPPEQRVLAAKLSLRGAQEIMDTVPGAYCQKVIATK